MPQLLHLQDEANNPPPRVVWKIQRCHTRKARRSVPGTEEGPIQSIGLRTIITGSGLSTISPTLEDS